MLKFYFTGAPNPNKVALFLEESGLPYQPVPLDTRLGQQFGPDYLRINPNSKVPAIEDGDTRVFDSNAILLYLAEKTGQFLPAAEHRAELLSWLMFVASGLGPFMGQAFHFRAYAPQRVDYAITRYDFEANRHLQVLESHLQGRDWMVGDDYSIVDMAVWGWARMAPMVLGDAAAARYPAVADLVARISARPAAGRALALKDRFAFKTETDAEARRFLFRHLDP